MKGVSTYYMRNSLLQKLGFQSYAEYLASDLWMKIRRAVLDRDDRRCRLCGEPTTIVHHIDYSRKTLCGRTLDGLAALCDLCHTKVEFDSDGNKRMLFQAVTTYYSLCRGRPPKKKPAKRQKKVSSKPRCACGNFKKKNKRMCKSCDPSRQGIV